LDIWDLNINKFVFSQREPLTECTVAKTSDSRSHLIDHAYCSENNIRDDTCFRSNLQQSRNSPFSGRKGDSPRSQTSIDSRNAAKALITNIESSTTENRSIKYTKRERQFKDCIDSPDTPRTSPVKKVDKVMKVKSAKNIRIQKVPVTDVLREVRKLGRPPKAVKSTDVASLKMKKSGEGLHPKIETRTRGVATSRKSVLRSAKGFNTRSNEQSSDSDVNNVVSCKRVIHLPGRYWENFECPMAVKKRCHDTTMSSNADVSKVLNYREPLVRQGGKTTSLKRIPPKRYAQHSSRKVLKLPNRIYSSSANDRNFGKVEENISSTLDFQFTESINSAKQQKFRFDINEPEFNYFKSADGADDCSTASETETGRTDEETRSNFEGSDDLVTGTGLLCDGGIDDWSNSLMTDNVDFDTMADKVCVVMLGALGEAELDMLESRLCDRTDDVDEDIAETVASEGERDNIEYDEDRLTFSSVGSDIVDKTPLKRDFSIFLPSPASSPPFRQSFAIALSQTSLSLSEISVFPISDSEYSQSQQHFQLPLSPTSPSKSPEVSLSQASLLRSISPGLLDVRSSQFSTYRSESTAISSLSQTSLISDLVGMDVDYMGSIPPLQSTDILGIKFSLIITTDEVYLNF